MATQQPMHLAYGKYAHDAKHYTEHHKQPLEEYNGRTTRHLSPFSARLLLLKSQALSAEATVLSIDTPMGPSIFATVVGSASSRKQRFSQCSGRRGEVALTIPGQSFYNSAVTTLSTATH